MDEQKNEEMKQIMKEEVNKQKKNTKITKHQIFFHQPMNKLSNVKNRRTDNLTRHIHHYISTRSLSNYSMYEVL